MHDQILASYAEEKVAKMLKHRPFSSLPTIQNLIAYNVQMERVYLCTQRGRESLTKRMLLHYFKLVLMLFVLSNEW